MSSPFYDSEPLDASASPGLESLPAENQSMPPMSDMGGTTAPPAPASLSAQPAAPSPGFAAPQGKTSGLGMADMKAARSGDDEEYLKNLPTAQKIGLMLESFSAGMQGRANPIDAMLATKQKREQEFRAELGMTVQAVKAGAETVRKMPPGKPRDAMVEMIVRSVNPAMGDTVREALSSSASDDGSRELRQTLSVLENPAAQALIAKTVANSPDPAGEAIKLMKDADFMKRVEQRADQGTLPTALAKVRVLSEAMSKMPDKYKDADGKPSFTMTDLREQNAKISKDYQLSEAELGALNRNQPSAIVYGLKTDTTQQAEQGAEGRRGPQSDIGKARADLIAKRITPEDFAAILKGKDNKITIQQGTIDKNAAATKGKDEGILTPEAIETAAARYNLDATLPSNLGRGTQGSVNTAKIVNRAAEIAKENGDTGEESRLRQIANKASSQALGQLTKQEQMVGAFEKNAVKNADIALGMSNKVDRTGVPVVNRWILAGQKEIAGDVDVAKFHAANETFVNEYAKVMSGSMGNTATTDSLRKAANDMLSTKQTPEQYKGVVDQMKLEMSNRMKGFIDQKSELTTSMRSSPKGEAAKEAAPSGGALPMPKSKAELVTGKTYQTSRGAAKWDGTNFVLP